MTIVTATVSKKINSHWFGRGRVISINVENGIAYLKMETGKEVGNLGGFDLQGLRFKTTRTTKEVL
jgi:hypothetical protein